MRADVVYSDPHRHADPADAEHGDERDARSGDHRHAAGAPPGGEDLRSREYDALVVREAILRETLRGGQATIV